MPVWWNGRHQGLKIPCCFAAYPFESGHRHHVKTRPQGHVAAHAPPHRPATLFFLFRRDPLTLGSRLIMAAYLLEPGGGTTSEITPHGSEKTIAKAVVFSSSVLRVSSFQNRNRFAVFRFCVERFADAGLASAGGRGSKAGVSGNKRPVNVVAANRGRPSCLPRARGRYTRRSSAVLTAARGLSYTVAAKVSGMYGTKNRF